MSVGFLDKVKEQGTALAAKAQEGVKQGQAKLDDGQARKKADGQLRDLGAWLWAQKNGRDDGQGDAEVSRLLGELSAFEAEYGALPLPVILPAGGEFNLETLDDSAAPPPPAAGRDPAASSGRGRRTATAGSRRARTARTRCRAAATRGRAAACCAGGSSRRLHPRGLLAPPHAPRSGAPGTLTSRDDQGGGVRCRRAHGRDGVPRRSPATPSSSSWPRSTRSHAGVDLRQVAGVDTSLRSRRRSSALAAPGPRSPSTSPSLDAARDNLAWCAEQRRPRRRRHHRLHDRRPRRPRAARSPRATALIAPNFAIGAVLMMRFAELAAPVLRDRRDHRAAPRPEDRRAVGHRDAHGRSAWRPRRRLGAPTPPRTTVRRRRARRRGRRRHPGALGAAARHGRPPGGAARHHRPDADASATTPTTARRSCPACCWRSRRVGRPPRPHDRPRRHPRVVAAPSPDVR